MSVDRCRTVVYEALKLETPSCIIKYLWLCLANYIVDYGHIKAVKYTIGEDMDCKEISANMEPRVYCNGPLKPDTWYHVRMRAFTDGGYTDSEIFMIKTSEYLVIIRRQIVI